ncbi:MAG: ATP-dependent dethiobiotin synthetase BioD [Actinomycetota bacterium]
MPELTVVVSGTSTEVGKTYLTARLAEELKGADAEVVARKPVQSFDPSDATTDADLLAAATGEDPLAVCPQHRRYPIAMAPPMAADFLGRSSFTIDQLVAELTLPQDGIALVEGIGGPRSPLARDGDTVSLADALDAELVVLVADSDLGAINAVRLSVGAFAPRPVVVFLNNYDDSDDLRNENLRWLRGQTTLDVFTSPQELASHLLSQLEEE